MKAQDIDEVRRIAATFPSASHRGFMLALVAAALWRTDEAREAEKLAEAAWTAYREGANRSQMTEEAIVWILAEAGMARKSGEIARAAGRGDLASYFAYSLRYIRHFRDAYEFEHYAGVHDKPSVPEPAIFALLRAGRLHEAVACARRFDDSPLKAKVIARASIRYMRAVPIHSPN